MNTTAFAPSLNCSKFERERLLEVLGEFAEEGWLADVLYTVKGGKEASVYCAQGRDGALYAAKVYRPRAQRAMKNYAVYQEGRPLHGQYGAFLTKREARAVRNKSVFGRKVETTSWTTHEFVNLRELWDAGLDVPRPHRLSSECILMDFLGDEAAAAPLLQEVALGPEEAAAVFDRLWWNIEGMLAARRVHGDLSPYNLVYWRGVAWIIDLPQALDPDRNPLAFALLQRDVDRVCSWFNGCGLRLDPAGLALDLWERWISGRL